ncbi:hypothetical protein [Candidatus Endolissoclinum faulkneri]|uniref:hypothetical protein n=1 Tax=Candidatus Endolissoclinum faulkneri TaxID=1263979 RepID=UPI0003F775F9|nr:hypothetical protein [Candidatus Endolissoclinum faulkneri]
MKRSEIFEVIEDLAGIEKGTLKGDEMLFGLGQWDSLTGAEFRAVVAENWNVQLSGVELEKAMDVQHIMLMLKSYLDD